jgi:uncharacterized protein
LDRSGYHGYISAAAVYRMWFNLAISHFLVYGCAYNEEMTYQWDKNKAAINLRKHGIDFADAVAVFSDDLAISTSDERFEEERFISIGLDALNRLLVVV